MRRVRLVSLRPPSFSGSGDSRRAASICAALTTAGADVRVTSVLRTDESLRSALIDWRVLLRVTVLVASAWRRRPLQCLVVEGIATTRFVAGISNDEFPVYITSRVVPVDVPRDSFIDFVDSLSNNCAERARRHTVMSPFWRREGRLLDEWESRLASHVAGSVAVTECEAALIGLRVGSIPIEMTQRESPSGSIEKSDPPTAIFAGNLYYHPNDEAARWIVTDLAPELARRGWDPSRIVIAGRRPKRRLLRLAEKIGVTVLQDVNDLSEVIRRSALSIAPMALGGGVQGKVLDVLAAGVPVVLTPKANTGLDLSDSQMVRVRSRGVVDFADAMLELLDSAKGGYRAALPTDVRTLLERAAPDCVQEGWREVLGPHIGS